MIPSLVKRTLKLPFYRTIPEIRSDRPTLGSIMSYTPYDLFCLRSQLQVLTSYTFEIESVTDLENEKMRMVFTYTTSMMDDFTEEQVNNIATQIIHLRSDYYPIWSNKSPFTKYRVWEQNVVVPIVESLFKDYGVLSVNGNLMLSLSGNDRLGDYIDIIERQTNLLQKELFKALNEGWISCDLDFSKKWNYIRHPEYDNIYVMDKRLVEQLHLTDISPCEFLFSMYMYPNDCLVIPIKEPYVDLETKYDISLICNEKSIIPAFMGKQFVVISSKYFNVLDIDFVLSLLSYVPQFDENREVTVEYREIQDNSTLYRLIDGTGFAVYIQLLKNDNKFFISTSNQK